MKRWKYFGIKPLCNLREDTALHIGNFCFPLCYRCSAIIINFIVATILLKNDIFSIVIGFLLMLPCLIDGILQYCFKIRSTNTRRIITGSIAGWGLAVLYIYVINLIHSQSTI